MEQNIFVLDNILIESVLKEGLLIFDGKDFLTPPGQIALIYHPTIKKFAFVFGTTLNNAGFVLLEDFEKTWKLK